MPSALPRADWRCPANGIGAPSFKAAHASVRSGARVPAERPAHVQQPTRRAVRSQVIPRSILPTHGAGEPDVKGKRSAVFSASSVPEDAIAPA
jgi:hypothetical protein